MLVWFINLYSISSVQNFFHMHKVVSSIWVSRAKEDSGQSCYLYSKHLGKALKSIQEVYVFFLSIYTVVTSIKYVLKPLMQFVFVPGFNCYSLGVDLTASTVSFAVNGIIQVTNVPIKELNHPNALIMSSKIIVFNEMYSLVNIYDTDLPTALAAKNGPGKLLAWNAANWTLTQIPNFQACGFF
jgi:hypothetical protein